MLAKTEVTKRRVSVLKPQYVSYVIMIENRHSQQIYVLITTHPFYLGWVATVFA